MQMGMLGGRVLSSNGLVSAIHNARDGQWFLARFVSAALTIHDPRAACAMRLNYTMHGIIGRMHDR